MIQELVRAYKDFFDAAREYAKIETTDHRNTMKHDEIMKRQWKARGAFLDTFKRLEALEKGNDTV